MDIVWFGLSLLFLLATIHQCRVRLSLRSVVGLLLCICSIPGIALEPVQRPPEQEQIMAMRLGTHQLHEGMIVYVDETQAFLPLTEMLQSLGLPIKVHGEDAYAEGWFREENNRFVLDVEKQRLVIAGVEQEIDWSQIEWDGFEIYIESELFKRCFDLRFDVLLNALLIRIDNDQWLPLEKKLVRHKNWGQVGQQVQVQLADAPAYDNPAHFIGWPTLDNTLRLGVSGRGGSLVQQYQYDLLASGELFWLNAMYSANVGHNSNTGLNFTGRLQLDRPVDSSTRWNFSVGDFTAPAIPLVTQQQDGVGFVISSFAQQQSAEFDRIGLSGDVLNGWDVEVYQNNQLVAFQTVDESNRYEFNELPVQFGLNLFRLVFYGPEGQRRESLEEFLIGDSMVPAGQSEWQFSSSFTNRRLLPGQDQFLFNRAAESDEDLLDRLQSNLAWRYGLSSAVSFNAGISRVPDNDGNVFHYANAGVQTGLGGVLYQLEHSQSDTGGRASRFTAQHLGDGNNWIAEYAEFRDYQSPLINSSAIRTALRHRAQLSWNGRFSENNPVNLQSRLEAFQDGAKEIRNSVRYSHRYGQLNTSLNLNHTLDNRAQDRIGAAQLLSYRGKEWELNGQFGFQLKPRQSVDSANFTGAWRINDAVNLRGNLRKAFVEGTDDSIGLNLSMAAQRLITSVALNYNFKSDFGLSVNFFSSLSREDRSWQAYAKSRNNTASLAMRVFLDKNQNEVFDGDDEPLSGVRFKLAGSGNFTPTDEQGRSVLSGLSTQFPLHISLNETSLDDPYWLPLRSSYKIQLRPGQSQQLDFPITQSAELEGTAWVVLNGKDKPAANVQVQLLNQVGQVVKEVRTAFDGFYVIDKIVPGQYQLRLVDEQLQRLKLSVQDRYELELSGDGDLQSGLDFRLLPTDEAT